jgi:hypothetical protein
VKEFLLLKEDVLKIDMLVIVPCCVADVERDSFMTSFCDTLQKIGFETRIEQISTLDAPNNDAIIAYATQRTQHKQQQSRGSRFVQSTN